jgi:hypothetical protein
LVLLKVVSVNFLFGRRLAVVLAGQHVTSQR